MIKKQNYMFILSLGMGLLLLLAGCVSNTPGTENGNLVSSYPETKPFATVNLANEDSFTLTASPARWKLNTTFQSAYAYNESIPGPLLKVKQGSQIKIHFVNQLPEPTTVHWHGVRVTNENDGVPSSTQKEVSPGESFDYTLDFPDAGLYWYHPHVREDRQQDMGMYGMIWVEPQNPLPEMNEFTWALDDIQVQNEKIMVSGNETTHALMGRYGNELLINGQPDNETSISQNEWVRFYLVNVSNARPLRFAIEDHSLLVRALDGGFLNQPTEKDYVTLAPSERAIVEVLFSKTGTFTIRNQTPYGNSFFGKITVTPSGKSPVELSEWIPPVAEQPPVEKLAELMTQLPDWEYEVSLDWPGMEGMMGGGGHMGHMMGPGPDGIEWQDTMAMMNVGTTSDTLTWELKDPATGKINMDIMRETLVDTWKIIRIKNPKDGLHPMQHPIHLHGQRFVVLREDGQPVENPVWKDTVLVPAGKTIDIAVEFSNPGEWMLHCHIAEHLESGMMTSIHVNIA